jgi:hypothetical protein
MNDTFPAAVSFDGDTVLVTLVDGTELRTAIALHPWLQAASLSQRANIELNPFDVFWPDLDDGIDIEWLRQQPPPPER